MPMSSTALSINPHRARRRGLRTLAAAATALATVLVGPVGPASADSVAVDHLSVGPGTGCSLREAILALDTLHETSAGLITCDGGPFFGADVTLDLAGDVTLTHQLPQVAGFGVTIDGKGHTIARAAGAEPFRLFVVGSGSLHVTDAVLRGGKVVGSNGPDGVDQATRPTDLCHTDTGTRTNCPGAAGVPGDPARGGAIMAYLHSGVVLDKVVLTGNKVVGGDGGDGDVGYSGGTESTGTAAEPSGVPGGDGGAGGAGGVAQGAAVYAVGSTVTITDSRISGNTAAGGTGGLGGGGANGADGVNGTAATCNDDGAGNPVIDAGDGGDGGDGGLGGRGGNAQGAAIYTRGGTTTVSATTVVDNTATGGNGGNGSDIVGIGGYAGQAGAGRYCGTPPFQKYIDGGAKGSPGENGDFGVGGAAGGAVGAAVFFDGMHTDAQVSLADTDRVASGPGGTFTLNSSTVARNAAKPGKYAAGFGDGEGAFAPPTCPQDVVKAERCGDWDKAHRDSGVGSAVGAVGHMRVQASTIVDNTTTLPAEPDAAYENSPVLDAGFLATWYGDVDPQWEADAATDALTADSPNPTQLLKTLAPAHPWLPSTNGANGFGDLPPVPEVTSTVLGPNKTIDGDGTAHFSGACQTVMSQAYSTEYFDNDTLAPDSGGHNLLYHGTCISAESTDQVRTSVTPAQVSTVAPVSAYYQLPGGYTVEAAVPTTGSAAIANGGLCADDGTKTDQREATRPATCDIGAFDTGAASPLLITTTTLPVAIVDTAFTVQLQATGGTPGYSWSASGLPDWMYLNSYNGKLSGTPPTAGRSWSFTVTVTDQFQTVSKRFTLVVAHGTEQVTVGGTMTYGDAAGASFFPDLELSGTVTCTKVKDTAGNTLPIDDSLPGTSDEEHQYTIVASSCAGPTTTPDGDAITYIGGDFTVTVPALAVTTQPPDAIAGSAYSATLHATGGTGSYSSWSATGLPSWLSLSADGTLSGTVPAYSSTTPDLLGTHTFSVTVTDSADHTKTQDLSITVYVGNRTGTVTATMQYGSDSAGITFKADFDPAVGTITCTTVQGGGSGVPIGPTLGVGRYRIDGSSCSPTASGNYKLSYTGGDLVVTRAPLTVTASDGSVTYGDPAPAITASFSGFRNDDTASTALSKQPSCSVPTYTAGDDARSYDTVCSGGAADNYTLTYDKGTLTVNPAGQQITFTSTPPTDAHYGGNYTPKATAPGGAVSFSVDAASDDGSCTIADGKVTFTGIGSCVIDADQAGGTDYQKAAQQQQKVTVSKAALSVTAPSPTLTYGDPAPSDLTPTYKGLVLGDSADDLAGTVQCSTGYQQGNDPGTYQISCPGTLSSPDYRISYHTGTLTVKKAELTVTPDDKSMTFGGSVPAFTFGYSGFVLGQGAAVLDTKPTCTAQANGETVTSSTPGGTYPITCSGGSDKDYTFSYQNKTANLTIRAASTTTRYTGDQTVLTGGGFTVSAVTGSKASECRVGQSVTFTADPVGGGSSVTLGTAHSAAGVASLDVDAGTLPAGAYEITATFDGTSSCSSSSDVTTLTVGSAAQAIHGGGWYYQPAGSTHGPKVSIDTLSLRQQRAAGAPSWKGDVQLTVAGQWQLRASTISAAVVAGEHGSLSGTGDLYRWNDTTGQWVIEHRGVDFTVSLTATGSGNSRTTRPGGLGLRLDLAATPGGPAVPNCLVQDLGGGHLAVS